MIDKGEIMVSAMSRVEKELKKIGITVADSYINKDRGYGMLKVFQMMEREIRRKLKLPLKLLV